MKRDISGLNVDALLIEFARLCIDQGKALELLKGESVIKSLGKRILEIRAELRKRPNSERMKLTRLFADPNSWVRFYAAKGCIDLAPAEAREQVERIADSGDYPVAGHAGMFLSLYDGDLSDFGQR